MKEVIIPEELTYIGVFLTFRCSFGCSYCINQRKTLKRRGEITPQEWIDGLNRLLLNMDLMVPITLQGGEPSVYTGYLKVIKGLKDEFYIDMLTNLDFDIEEFMREIPPNRLQRDVPYASIRVSYHPEFSDLDRLLEKIVRLQDNGYSIGLFVVDHPETDIDSIKEKAVVLGVDFRTKEFLGVHDSNLYGQYKYPDAVNGKELKAVQCKTTEMLIAPDGYIHRCHRDLYHGENPVAHILDEDLSITFPFRGCDRYGECNPCDIKIKNNRFQQFGHCSVIIRDNYGITD